MKTRDNDPKRNRVVVVGGAGYVGAVLVPKLLNVGYRVKVIDLFLYGGHMFDRIQHNPRFIAVRGDMRDSKLLEREFMETDAVIHLACISNDPSFELDPELSKSINYDATVNLMDVAKKTKVKRFIYASTSSVYGIKKEREVTEDLSLEPLTDYSRYKALCETYLLELQSPQFTTLILRPATVCGYSPRLRLDLTVNMFTIQALVNKKITVFGGTQKRPNIHIDDMADAYIVSLSAPKDQIAGKIYNVGYENYTIIEIATMVKRILNDPTIAIIVTPTNDMRSYHVSSKKIDKEIGFRAKRSVEKAIDDLHRAYKKGYIKHPLTNSAYYNIKTLQKDRHNLLYA